MKKAISLLVAIATTASISVAAFAADDIPGRVYSDTVAIPRISATGPDEEYTVSENELYLVDETNKVVGGIYNRLDPDTEYKFRIFYKGAGNYTGTATDAIGGTELTGAILDGGNIRLRTVRGSSNIQSARIKTTGRGTAARYELVINTRATYGTKVNEVEYSLNVTGSKSSNVFKESTHIFEVGYESVDDADTDIGEGGYITISNDYPVITKEQFVDIAKSVNYKTVIFEAEDGGWQFTGRVSGMGDSNFFYNYDVIPELINRHPDQEYKFLNFKAGVTFPASGEMRIDVSDIYDDFGTTMYAYLYRNGKLTPIDSTYDSGANEIVFRTNYLGSFVVTDTRITDTDIINNNNDNEDEDDEDEDEDDDNTLGSGNPNTGAGSAMNIAMTLGLASLLTAGAVTRKKK